MIDQPMHELIMCSELPPGLIAGTLPQVNRPVNKMTVVCETQGIDVQQQHTKATWSN